MEKTNKTMCIKESKNDKVIQVGQLLANHSQAYTLYDANGLCPTIASGQKRFGGLPTWIKYEQNMAEQQKYNSEVMQVGNIMQEKNFANPQCGRIYSTKGLSPTINTCGGGQREPKNNK